MTIVSLMRITEFNRDPLSLSFLLGTCVRAIFVLGSEFSLSVYGYVVGKNERVENWVNGNR